MLHWSGIYTCWVIGHLYESVRIRSGLATSKLDQIDSFIKTTDTWIWILPLSSIGLAFAKVGSSPARSAHHERARGWLWRGILSRCALRRITAFPCFYIRVLDGHFLTIATIEPPFHTIFEIPLLSTTVVVVEHLLFEKKGVSITDGGFETQTGSTYAKTLHCALEISRWIIFWQNFQPNIELPKYSAPTCVRDGVLSKSASRADSMASLFGGAYLIITWIVWRCGTLNALSTRCGSNLASMWRLIRWSCVIMGKDEAWGRSPSRNTRMCVWSRNASLARRLASSSMEPEECRFVKSVRLCDETVDMIWNRMVLVDSFISSVERNRLTGESFSDCRWMWVSNLNIPLRRTGSLYKADADSWDLDLISDNESRFARRYKLGAAEMSWIVDPVEMRSISQVTI